MPKASALLNNADVGEPANASVKPDTEILLVADWLLLYSKYGYLWPSPRPEKEENRLLRHAAAEEHAVVGEFHTQCFSLLLGSYFLGIYFITEMRF